jgi:hypothetical protein
MYPSIVVVAACDPDLRGAPLSILIWAHAHLDFEEYRPLKVAFVATEVKLKEVTAAWALKRLVDAGYLKAGEKVDRVRTYRLVGAKARAELLPKVMQFPTAATRPPRSA